MRNFLRLIFKKLGILDWGQKAYLSFLEFKQKMGVKVFLPIFASSGFLSSFYYTFFSQAFNQTHKSVLKGKIKHLKNLYNDKENEYLLANYIHAIEKGLTMKDRKEIFALAYIKKTVKAYESVILGNSLISPERIKWFYDILDLYFKEAGEHIIIKKAKTHFYSLPRYISENENCFVPFKRSESVKSNIQFDEFYKLTQQRRSVRWFQNKKVPHELIDKAISACLLSPSACNRQPFRFLIYDEKEWLSKLSSLPSGTKGFGYNIPALAIVVGMTDAYESERDKNVFYIDASLASMSFMLALETLGLGSCALNWPDIKKREKALRSVLDLDITDRVVMFIAFGFPEENNLVGASSKKSVENIRYYNKKK
jgi:nitroreductase